DLGINKVQGGRVREHVKKGISHYLMSNSADPFYGSNVRRNQHHRFIVHGCNNLDRFVAKRLIEPGQGDLHYLRARALNRMIYGVGATKTNDYVGVEGGVFVDVLWILRLPSPAPSPACHSLRKALFASLACIFI